MNTTFRAIVLSTALVSGLMTMPVAPAAAATTQCRERAIDYCSTNWESDGYASNNACIYEQEQFECGGEAPPNPPPGGPGLPPCIVDGQVVRPFPCTFG